MCGLNIHFYFFCAKIAQIIFKSAHRLRWNFSLAFSFSTSYLHSQMAISDCQIEFQHAHKFNFIHGSFGRVCSVKFALFCVQCAVRIRLQFSTGHIKPASCSVLCLISCVQHTGAGSIAQA